MKILYLITSTTVGGAERSLSRLARGLDRSKFTPAGVVSLKPAGPVAAELEAAGIKVVSVNMGYIPGPAHLRELRRAIDSFQPDIVHAFLYRAIQFARAVKGDWKLVTSPRVNYRTRAWPLRVIDRFGKGKDDMVICEARATSDFMADNLGYDPARLRVIHNGVAPLSATAEQAAEVRASFGLEDGELLILSAGRLSRQKGFPYLLSAMKEVCSKTSARLVIAGEGEDRTALEKQTASLGLGGRVLLVGEKPDLAPWYRAADIFVLPSLWEGLPNCLLEGMSLGVPCVATAVDGTLEVCQPGRDALLVPPADSAALAKALLALSRDGALRERLSSNARKNIEANFSMRRMLAQYSQAYEDVLRG